MDNGADNEAAVEHLAPKWPHLTVAKEMSLRVVSKELVAKEVVEIVSVVAFVDYLHDYTAKAEKSLLVSSHLFSSRYRRSDRRRYRPLCCHPCLGRLSVGVGINLHEARVPGALPSGCIILGKHSVIPVSYTTVMVNTIKDDTE